jgi:hypothetical protein
MTRTWQREILEQGARRRETLPAPSILQLSNGALPERSPGPGLNEREGNGDSSRFGSENPPRVDGSGVFYLARKMAWKVRLGGGAIEDMIANPMAKDAAQTCQGGGKKY